MERRISAVKKNEKGVIVKVKGSLWKEDVSDVVRHIENGIYDYYVEEDQPKAEVHVYAKKFIRTNADANSRNNLDNLSEFQ